jgi:hypothetical protein
MAGYDLPKEPEAMADAYAFGLSGCATGEAALLRSGVDNKLRL